MSKTQGRALIIGALTTVLVGILTVIIVVTTLRDSQQLAAVGWIGSFWMNLLAGAMAAVFSARRAAQPYEDPRLGRVLGTALGLWSGLGAVIGQIMTALFTRAVYGAQIPAGQVGLFSLLMLVVCVIASSIAGREAAQPKEEEEA